MGEADGYLSGLFIVVDGIPSVGVQVLIGSGTVEDQFVEAAVTLPTSNEGDDNPSAEMGGGETEHDSSATSFTVSANQVFVGGLMVASAAALL